MCGIVGIVSKNGKGFSSKEAELFDELLYADAVRGMDSTGVFSVSFNNEVKVRKQAANPGIFLQTKSYKDWRTSFIRNGKIIIGHNRKATWGEVTTKNAHPFVDKDMVLVHNGYIGNHKELDSKVDVDSQAIITALHDEKDDVTKGLQKLLGAYAIVWYDHKKKKLFLARNKERPLAVAHNDDHMFIASEKGMLRWLFERNSISTQIPVDIPQDKVVVVTFDPFKMEGFDIPPAVRPLIVQNRSFGEYPSRHDLESGGYIDPWEMEGDQAENMTELGRARKMAQEASEELEKAEEDVKELMKRYGGQWVLFETKTSTAVGDGTARIITVLGTAWQPGKKPAKAIYTVEKKNDDEVYIDHGVPLLAQVDSISRRNTDVKLIVKNLRLASSIVKDFKGHKLSHEEWKMICARIACDYCAKAPNSMRPDGTQVFITGNKDYGLICDKCTEDAEIKMHAAGAAPINGGSNGG